MRTFTIVMFVAVVLCAASGCDSEDPVRGDVPICDTDPSVAITFPDLEAIWGLTSIVDFEWVSDTPCDIVMTRYLIMPIAYDYDVLTDLSENPERFEGLWSRWMSCNWSGGNAVRLESELEPGMPGGPPSMHVFAVQARAKDGKVTEEFIDGHNAVIFDCRYKFRDGPWFMISEDNFLGDLAQYTSLFYFPYIVPGSPLIELPGGCPYKFSFEGDAEFYGRRVAGYRFGWDVPDPEKWAKPFTMVNETPQVMFESGEHRLTVEVIDDIGLISSVTFIFDFIPMTMERDLLWIDDLLGAPEPFPMRTMPTEDEHDLFWEGLCSRNAGFDPGIDIYDVMENNNEPPTVELLSHYKNVIWTYSISSRSAWENILRRSDRNSLINFLPMFMAQGGHIWTLGRPGGLRKVHSDDICLPVSVECPVSGDFTIDPMPYRDYGVTVVDGVVGRFCTGEEMPPGVRRSVDRDALYDAYSDESDPLTLAHPDLPATLELWDEITDCPWCFFNIRDRGFFYVEVYNPQYWMDFKFLTDQTDFHPMYRMRSMNILSPMHHQTIAIWVTKYEDVLPEVAAGQAVAAPSVHMGFPLWFFDHDKANQIADVIFEEWGLLE
ncbi:MAG: hypothetical protein KOO63_16110 [Bacteroidales bacterium]|nr:hypothetical protein [Candidatus Latescibacterota bacterium]